MTEHTKTPWTVHRYDRPSGGVAISGPDTEKTNAFVATALADSRTIEEAHANAAFIVRAVNCHAAVVDELPTIAFLLDRLRDYNNDDADSARQFYGHVAPAIFNARAALIRIEKALGETP